MSRIIRVPRFLRDEDLSQFFERWTWFTRQNEPVVLDFEDCEFLAPWAWALFTAYALWLQEVRGLTVTARLRAESRVGEYGRRLGVGSLLPLPEGPVTSVDEMRTSPLARIRSSKDIQTFADSTLRILSVPDEDVAGAVKYSLIELMRNVVQHAASPIGGLAAAQYFPKADHVQIVVVDTGVGLRATLQPKYPGVKDDTRAVRLAALPHVSGTFPPAAYGGMQENAGLGLFFIRQIAFRSGGHFFLASGTALADVWGTVAGEEKRRYVFTSEGWPGTFAVIQLRGRSIVDFSQLLEVCRQLAAEARRDPSRASLDFLAEPIQMPEVLCMSVREFAEDVETAAVRRDQSIIPTLRKGEIVILDFEGLSFVTQSFVHALLYKVFRDAPAAQHGLSFARCTDATKEAIFAVSAYAKADETSGRRPRKR
jgi:uncharacterized protein DUF4325